LLVLDRRQFVAITAGSLVAAHVSRSLGKSEGGLNALLDVFVDEILTKNPEQITSLGLDKGRYAWAKSQLSDASLGRVRQEKKENADRLRRLQAFDRNSISGSDLANYDTVAFQMETSARTQRFKYGEGVRPYVVSQLTGAYQNIPTFLDRQHTIETREDADAYMARLRAFALVLDQETERVRHDAGLKVSPPDFLLDRTLQQIRALRAYAPAESILATSIATRTRKKEISGDYGAEAARIVTTEVYPALDRQAAIIQELRARSMSRPGSSRPEWMPSCAAREKPRERSRSVCRRWARIRSISIPTRMPADSRSWTTATASSRGFSPTCRSFSACCPSLP
jgi:uncharacterized protein (DUF885 family)